MNILGTNILPEAQRHTVNFTLRHSKSSNVILIFCFNNLRFQFNLVFVSRVTLR